jgi:PA-IL-like protein
MRSIFSRVLFMLASIFVLSAAGLADTIRLKDGSIIKGHIVSFASGSFVVEIGEGSRRRQLTFTVGEIQAISFDPSSPATATNRNASYTEPEQKPIVPPVVVQNDPKPSPPASTEKMKPIEWNVRVTADNTSNGWTNTGWVVKRGQRIRITGDGKVSLGRGQNSPPSGLPDLEDTQKLLKNVATGALVAVIGDDNNDFIYVGAEREFTATRDGALFLGINEGYLEDNSGTFNVKIEILPDEVAQTRLN